MVSPYASVRPRTSPRRASGPCLGRRAGRHRPSNRVSRSVPEALSRRRSGTTPGRNRRNPGRRGPLLPPHHPDPVSPGRIPRGFKSLGWGGSRSGVGIALLLRRVGRNSVPLIHTPHLPVHVPGSPTPNLADLVRVRKVESGSSAMDGCAGSVGTREWRNRRNPQKNIFKKSRKG